MKKRTFFEMLYFILDTIIFNNNFESLINEIKLYFKNFKSYNLIAIILAVCFANICLNTYEQNFNDDLIKIIALFCYTTLICYIFTLIINLLLFSLNVIKRYIFLTALIIFIFILNYNAFWCVDANNNYKNIFGVIKLHNYNILGKNTNIIEAEFDTDNVDIKAATTFKNNKAYIYITDDYITKKCIINTKGLITYCW